MNPAQLLAHFDRISDAPDAIPRLRQTVLNLAVRGKLVPQDSREAPVAQLLQQIDHERNILAKEDRRANADRMELLAAEWQWDVPPTWDWRGVADLALFIDYRGKTPTKTDSGIRLITAKNVRRGQVNPDPEEFITEGTYRAWMTRGLPRRGDILFTTEAPMGNAAVVRLDEKFGLAQRVINFRLYGDLDSDFLVLQLLSEPFQSILDKTATGLTAKGIKAAKLKRLPLAVPPLAEQHRIVAKVDELMALCDRLEAAQGKRENRRDRLAVSSLHRLNNGADADAFHDHARFYFNHLPRLTTRTEHIQQLRQTILNLVVRGKLVPQDPNDEPASELLKKIEQTKRQLIAARELRQGASITNSIDRRSEISIPKSWAWTKCDKILFVTKLAGFEYTKHFELSSEGDIPVIRAQNVRPWRIDRNNLLYVDNKTSETLERSALTKPCILVTFIGAGIGDVAFFNEELRWHLAPNVAKAEVFIGCEDLLDLMYLVLFLNSPFGRAEIFKHMKSTAQPSISMGTIRDIDLAIPPLAEQQRIVAKVDELMALCDKLDAQLTTTHIDNSRLLEAVLAEQLHHDVAPMGG
jgi:type I restriction enzyme, S subunit